MLRYIPYIEQKSNDVLSEWNDKQVSESLRPLFLAVVTFLPRTAKTVLTSFYHFKQRQEQLSSGNPHLLSEKFIQQPTLLQTHPPLLSWPLERSRCIRWAACFILLQSLLTWGCSGDHSESDAATQGVRQVPALIQVQYNPPWDPQAQGGTRDLGAEGR